MLLPEHLSREVLERIVAHIQETLYWDGAIANFNADTQWDSETIELVAEILKAYHLTPDPRPNAD